MPGPATSEAEVTNISKHGFWLLVDGRELFLPFAEFPWFKRLRSRRSCASSAQRPDTCTGLSSTSTSRSTRSSTPSGTRSSPGSERRGRGAGYTQRGLGRGDHVHAERSSHCPG